MRGARSSDPLLLPRVALILLLLLAGAGAAAADEDEEAAFPFEAAPTDLILRGEPGDPTAVVRVEMLRGLSGPGELILSDAAGAPLHRVAIEAESSGRVLRLPVPMPPEGVALAFEVRLTEGSAIHRREVTVPRPDPDWVLHFIPGFHYDPVWWNTQEHYTETGHYMDAHVGPGIELVGEYLDTLRDDPDLTVAFHQLPYGPASSEGPTTSSRARSSPPRRWSGTRPTAPSGSERSSAGAGMSSGSAMSSGMTRASRA
jgi:hypothetical protein